MIRPKQSEMSKFSRKAVAVGLALTTAVWLAGSILPASAQTTAQTIATLMAQIQALTTQLQALQASSGSSVSSYSYTRDLTTGSSGADVSALQQMLINGGYLKISAPTGYFGSLTTAALAAYQKAMGISPAAGYFGPKTRAYVASAGGTTVTSGGTTVVVPAGSGLSVTLAADNPVAGNVPVNLAASSEVVPVLRMNFTAGSAPVTVTSLTVNRSGLSSDQDLSNVYLKYEGGAIIATNLGISNGAVNFTNPAGLFTVPAGQSVEMTIAVSIVSSATGHTYLFSVPSASSIVTVGSLPVSGTFPITGNTMTSASVGNLGGIQITNASAGYTGTSASGGFGLSVNAGQTQFNVGQFTFQAQNQAVQVNSITFTSTGSTGPSDVQNYKLYNAGTLISTVPGLSSGNTVVFSNLGMQLAAGQAANLYVYADIVGGVNRNFQLSIQHNYDVSTKDMMFNIGFLPSVIQSAGGNASLNTFPAYGSFVSVSAGTLTVSKDANTPSNYVLPGGTNQTIGKIDFQANGEAVRITSLSVALGGTMPTYQLSNINNLKLIDDQGTQIGTTQNPVSASTTPYTSLNYVIQANQTRVLSVVADVASAATGTLTASINSIVGQGYTSLAAISNAGQSGNQLTASTNILTATQNSGLGTVNVVAGQAAARIGSFALTAGAASAVSVSNLQVMVSSTAATYFQNLKVMVGSTQVGQTQSTIVSGNTYTFSASTPFQVSAGGQLIVDVYADVKTGVGTATLAAVSMPATGVSAVALSTNQPISNVNGGLTTAIGGQTDNVVAAGTLSYAATNMPTGIQVGMGTTGVQLAQYTITGSNNEAINVQNVWVTATSSLTGALVYFRLQDSSGNWYGGTATTGSNLNGTGSPYTFEFVGVNIPISQGGQLGLKLIADANNYTALSASYPATGATSTALINQIDYQGKASQQTASATSTSYSNTFTVLRTTLSAAGVSATPGSSPANQQIGAFTFTAGSGANATIGSTTIAMSVYNASSSAATTTLSVINLANGATYTVGGANGITTNIGPGNGIGTLGTSTIVTFNPAITVTAGQSVTLQFFAVMNTGGLSTRSQSGTAVTTQTNLSSWTWSDGTANNLGPNPSYNLPTAVITGSPSPIIVN